MVVVSGCAGLMWDQEWRKNLMSAALELVRHEVSPRQFQIFDLYALQNWSPREVARTLRISTAQGAYLDSTTIGS